MSEQLAAKSLSSTSIKNWCHQLPLDHQLSYSIRRFFVDEFQVRMANSFSKGCTVLDLGGVKSGGRGKFNLENYQVNRTVLNIDRNKLVDLVADGARMPLKSKSYDVVLCAEVMEHVGFPDALIKETKRILKPGGEFVITAPFLFREHADPQDYGRYTEHYWNKQLETHGFDEIHIEKQGLFFSVATDMLRDWARFQVLSESAISKFKFWSLSRIVRWARRKSIQYDTKPETAAHSFLGSYTTGFGIRAKLSD